jgi:hypothetical protein
MGILVMSKLSDLTPIEPQRIMDLVRAAGVDVSDWANFKAGEKNAASNPKYCYDWSFIEPNRVVVLNLWFRHLKEQNGTIQCDFNMHEAAHKAGNFQTTQRGKGGARNWTTQYRWHSD